MNPAENRTTPSPVAPEQPSTIPADVAAFLPGTPAAETPPASPAPQPEAPASLPVSTEIPLPTPSTPVVENNAAGVDFSAIQPGGPQDATKETTLSTPPSAETPTPQAEVTPLPETTPAQVQETPATPLPSAEATSQVPDMYPTPDTTQTDPVPTSSDTPVTDAAVATPLATEATLNTNPPIEEKTDDSTSESKTPEAKMGSLKENDQGVRDAIERLRQKLDADIAEAEKDIAAAKAKQEKLTDESLIETVAEIVEEMNNTTNPSNN